MTDAVVACRVRRIRRALDELPDDLLEDIGLRRSDIPFVADALASGNGRTVAHPRAAVRRLPHVVLRLALVVVAVVSAAILSRAVLAQDAEIRRGKYLVGLAGCNDCHTPGYFFGKPDMARFLGGSEVGFEIPDVGVFHGPNLTPDQGTGLGKWSTEEIVTALTKGRRPDGRILAPIMPWHAFATLTPQDARAIVAFLKSLPPVKNKVPGPFGPSEKPTSFVMKVVPPAKQ
jgi:mono/diheme cytochrome c family protein